ncbi:NAD(P)H-dependent oxidoreductase [Empedobacter stercoris]|uniref:NAD(P)H-dependent oxidoreductase n=2 Tax=Empedobacter TaxID=59734 RepID=A0ABY8VAN1_9FLAO|nr:MULTISPECIES: NAD(P)H-dependent oxidoreductase [Empedobacter]NOJ74415.1 NAD(P)H-dependent oxidoreductase [Empedobacter stercoris]UWX67612.1 NAD(P)H-dependent oxidoreductase [Empedobacter stercoris]WIH97800.1 NAD(P)H-dependent oxidoreductase [Empedobacter falsenii]HJD86971.1 NAD(P)H-dependent oxidoreductase [Empedobacter falsenii]
MKILAFAGSNSKTSINKQLLNYTLNQIENAEIDLIDINDFEMPIYSTDRQVENGFPQEAQDFYKKVQDADGLVISLAEHNGNFSVALKNILDWVSRIDMPYLKGKKLLLLSTSPGGYGGGNVMEVATKYFGMFASGEIVASTTFPSFHDNFQNNEIVNEELKNKVLDQVNIFVEALAAVEA